MTDLVSDISSQAQTAIINVSFMISLEKVNTFEKDATHTSFTSPRLVKVQLV